MKSRSKVYCRKSSIGRDLKIACNVSFLEQMLILKHLMYTSFIGLGLPNFFMAKWMWSKWTISNMISLPIIQIFEHKL